MSTFNFSAVNVTYILEARRLIHQDRPMAKILLRMSDELFDFIDNMTQDQINVMGQIKAPLATFNINQKALREFMSACKKSDNEALNAFNDRLLTD